MNEMTLKIILAVLASNGIFTFFQFLLQRKDNKNDKFEILESKIDKGLEEREEKGKERYTEHQESIEELRKAIFQLAENDKTTKEYLNYVGDEIMGLAHDRLVKLTDMYQERGAITLKEKATLDAIYKPYHEGLHGNGDGKIGYEFAMKLPVVTDSQAREMDLAKKAFTNA